MASECGAKHLKLVAMIVGIVLAVCGGTVVYSVSAASDMDKRVREVEKNDAANAARFEEIQRALSRLERRIFVNE